MHTCYIVGAAPYVAAFSPDETDLVIAADGGWRTLAARGITPGLVVGDFDSSECPDGVEVIRHPVEKDDTDTALAIREGMVRGYEVFVLHGCTGGRSDHTFGAVQTLYHLAKEGMYGYLVGEDFISTVLVDRALRFSPRGTVSVFSLTDVSEGVCIRGLKYTLENARLTNHVPLGVSNEGNGGEAEICVRRGALLVMWRPETAL